MNRLSPRIPLPTVLILAALCIVIAFSVFVRMNSAPELATPDEPKQQPAPLGEGLFFTSPDLQFIQSLDDRVRGWEEIQKRRRDVRGIYLTAWAAANPQKRAQVLEVVANTKLNAVVIDTKADSGCATYRSEIPGLDEVGGVRAYIPDLTALVREFKREQDVYLIARIVCFKDPILVKMHPELAVQDVNGGVWLDAIGAAWSDPYHPAVWDYNLAFAIEAARAGFDEIQFDYVRFPSDGKLSRMVFPHADGRDREDVVAEFLSYAKHALRVEGVPLSADVFGLVCSAVDDVGIGQHLETLAPQVDYISPMVYPSHYALRSYGLADPDAMPYETVLASMTDACRRLGEQEKNKLRPWLQDFSIRHKYGVAEVQAQIAAVNAVGLDQWLLWHPGSSYTWDALPR
ncbi:MAG TPA: putative glycoside hydrolase [Firmicutes bacterium]|jgi:hypothetical protein|nr:putative glycoside hydrolase [Bacillota bacterium]